MLEKVALPKFLKYTLLILGVILIAVIAVIIYRLFFQFSAKDINEYINEEAAKYQDKEAAYKIIKDGVEYILGSHNLTQQVLKSAKVTKTDKEQELVNAAVNQCKAFNYLPA